MSEADLAKMNKAEQQDRITALLADGVEVVSLVVEAALDKADPKKVQQVVKDGFQRKIDKLVQEHAEAAPKLRQDVEDGKCSQSFMQTKLANLDGKIRSMKWFLSTIGGA